MGAARLQLAAGPWAAVKAVKVELQLRGSGQAAVAVAHQTADGQAVAAADHQQRHRQRATAQAERVGNLREPETTRPWAVWVAVMVQQGAEAVGLWRRGQEVEAGERCQQPAAARVQAELVEEPLPPAEAGFLCVVAGVGDRRLWQAALAGH